MKVRKAVIPAAGFGTRFLPIAKALPKEMLPLVDRPLLHYAVEEAVEAGIDRIILVTSRGKTVSEEYFDVSPELERALETREHPHLEEVRRISRMADIITVRQREPLGLGHAVLAAKRAVGNEPFVVYLPDDIIHGIPSATHQMLPVFERHGSVVAVEKVPPERVSAYGIVAGDDVAQRVMRLSKVVEKPAKEEALSDLGIVGRYVFTPEVFDCLERVTPSAIGELQLTDAIAMLVERGDMYSYAFRGVRYDCGTPVGLLKASVELALERPEMAAEVREWLRGLVV